MNLNIYEIKDDEGIENRVEDETTPNCRKMKEVRVISDNPPGEIVQFEDGPSSRYYAVRRIRKALTPEIVRSIQVFNELRESEVQHPNCVELYGACYRDSSIEIYTRYCDVDLWSLVKDDPSLTQYSFARRLDWARQAAAGLEYLHTHPLHITHGDVKLTNFLYSRDDDRVRISDVGLVSFYRGCGSSKIGTLYFCPPETAQPPFNSTSASDVYSFSLAMWELLASQSIIDALSLTTENWHSVMYIDEKRPPLNPDWDPELKSLLARGWQPAPPARPPISIFSVIFKELFTSTRLYELSKDPDMRQFWRHQFGTQFVHNHKVTWESFIREFYSYFALSIPDIDTIDEKNFSPPFLPLSSSSSSSSSSNDILSSSSSFFQSNWEFLKQMLQNKVSADVRKYFLFKFILSVNNEVSVQRLAKLVDLFHPFDEEILDRLDSLFFAPYFHPDLTHAEAQALLSKQETGSWFLLRFDPGDLVLELSAVSNGQLFHFPIVPRVEEEDDEIVFRVNHQTFESIEEVVEAISQIVSIEQKFIPL